MASRGLFPHREATYVSARNSIFQQLESLKTNRQKRYRLNLTVIEGFRLIEAARRFRVPMEAIVYSDKRHLSPWAQEVVRNCQPERLLALSPTLFADLSRKADAPELIAVVRTPEDRLSRINLSTGVPLILILDRPSKPGNIGSIIRSADALGVDGVIVFGHAADVYSPEAVTASMGSLFSVPTIRVNRVSTLFGWISDHKCRFPGLRMVGADERGETILSGCDLTRPTIFVIGNEAEGISTALQTACDVKTRIPMTGFASSLNAACATTICLYEAVRQRSEMEL